MSTSAVANRPRHQAIPVPELEEGMRVWGRGVVIETRVGRKSSNGRGNRSTTHPDALKVLYITFDNGETLSYGWRERILLDDEQ